MATTLPRTGTPVWLGLAALAVAAQTAAASGTPPLATAAGAAASASGSVRMPAPAPAPAPSPELARAPAQSASAATAAAAPSGPYRSVFDDYRSFAEQPLAPWRASNDTVGRIGGWRAYARESQGEPAPASNAGPGPRGHTGLHR
jgi:hypothetical protein